MTRQPPGGWPTCTTPGCTNQRQRATPGPCRGHTRNGPTWQPKPGRHSRDLGALTEDVEWILRWEWYPADVIAARLGLSWKTLDKYLKDAGRRDLTDRIQRLA